MSKTYMIIYNGFSPSRQALIAWLDSQPRILNWQVTPLNPLFIVVWDGTIVELSDLIRQDAGIETFVAVEAGADKFGKDIQGWLPRGTWEFILANSGGGQAKLEESHELNGDPVLKAARS